MQTTTLNTPSYFAYWGKARPASVLPDSSSPLTRCTASADTGTNAWHLLAFHALDVAACGQALLTQTHFSLQPLAQELDWPLPLVERLCVFFLALHDLGKFARAFQNLAPDLSPSLVPSEPSKHYTQRHDTLGWSVWQQYLAAALEGSQLPHATHEFWAIWVRSAVGHHGRPPCEYAHGGSLPIPPCKNFFARSDLQAVHAFTGDVANLLLSGDSLETLKTLPVPSKAQQLILKKHSWRLAGLAVLADWLGSNQSHFAYRTRAQPLATYWIHTAQPQARYSVQHAGLAAPPVRPWAGAEALFPYLKSATPLQDYAASEALGEGPQLFLLEDVTGAGKTEAALILAHRLMSAGHAQGLYFALPSMATANQMYQRVGAVYRYLYLSEAQPSLILAHGARQLVTGFQSRILGFTATEPITPSAALATDFNYQADETSASNQCSAWLADSHKKALLADVGVGTLDQALLAVLPAKHQALRLLGLSGKVLIIDEVHAYDLYMRTLLKNLLLAHAQQGGSAILLSATLPSLMRAELAAAFQIGRGLVPEELGPDQRYPLVTHVNHALHSHACATRAQLIRQVEVVFLHSEQAVLECIAAEVQAGHCVCWIRNTVADARQAYTRLRALHPAMPVQLFHSHFAMADRLDIEGQVLARFGKQSGAAVRRGQVLIATQVVEQSLDLCFDAMVSDLAPIDLIIQRAGRLQRHARLANGEPAADGLEHRAAPRLHLLCPAWSDSPAATWYKAFLPKASYVYTNPGQLWLTQRALRHAGCILSPGRPEEAGAVRNLVEAVYGDESSANLPQALECAHNQQEGEGLAKISQAQHNTLQLEHGYCITSSSHWYEDSRTPTRLSDDSITIYLARADGKDQLQAWRSHAVFPWEQSAARISVHSIQALAPAWQSRFATAIQKLRSHHHLLEEPALVLPLVEEQGVWQGWCQNGKGPLRVVYDTELGLFIDKASQG